MYAIYWEKNVKWVQWDPETMKETLSMNFIIYNISTHRTPTPSHI